MVQFTTTRRIDVQCTTTKRFDPCYLASSTFFRDRADDPLKWALVLRHLLLPGFAAHSFSFVGRRLVDASAHYVDGDDGESLTCELTTPGMLAA